MEGSSKQARRRPRWQIWGAASALVVIALAVFAWVFDWNWFKGTVERRVAAATGRQFTIDGELDVDLGRVVRISVARVRLSNAPWAQGHDMAQAERADLHVAFWPLLRGRVSLPALHLVRPRLLLERNAQGEANWKFAGSSRIGASPRAVQIDQLTVDDGVVELIESKLETHMRVNVRSAPADRRSGVPPLLIAGGGKYRDTDFDVRGRIDSPLETMRGEQRYRIDLRARAGATLAHARGTLRSAVQFQDFDLDFLLMGDDLARLYHLLGLALPETPPYQLEGRLSHTGDLWRFRDFSGRMGDSDLSGTVSIDVGGERALMRGQLVSARLDLDDLAGALGATPQTKEGESASTAQRARAAERAASPTVLPDTPYDLAKLRSMNADVTIRAAAINAPRLPLESLRTRVVLQDGILRLEPLEIGAAGGTLRGEIILDARTDPITTTADLRVRGLDLPRVFPKIKSPSTGRIAGDIKLAGKGNTVAAMLGSSDGSVELVMGPARVSNLLVELAGLDVAEALRYAVGKDRMIGVRCAYADLDVENGTATSQALVFDTTDTAIVGAGTIDLGNEALDLELRPRPKDPSPVALRVPLQIEGTFKDPSFRPKTGPLAARAAAAAVLYAIAPPAALLALLETGPGENVQCGEARREAKLAEQESSAAERRPSPQD